MELFRDSCRTASSARMYAPLDVPAQDNVQHYNVPFMRTSATVRRRQQEDVFPTSSGSGLQEKLTVKSDDRSSTDLHVHVSSNIDRQFALHAVNALTTLSHTKEVSETSGPTRFKRVRPDLPEPSKLRKKPKKLGKTWSTHAAATFNEHQNQLRHKCLDFNWGKPIIEVRNKQKPEQAVATARRRRLDMAARDFSALPAWEPRSRKDTASLVGKSGTCFDVSRESRGKRWTVGATKEQNVTDEKISSYLFPPKQPRFLQQSSQNTLQEHLFMLDDVTTSTPSSTVSSYNTTDWLWKTQDTSPSEALKIFAKNPVKSKFVEE